MPEASVPTVAPSAPDLERPRLSRWFAQKIPARWHPVLIVAAGIVAASAARFCLDYQIPFPFCLLRKTTGVPCPACGSTRSLVAWTHLDPIAALRFNPLFFAVTVGLALWALTALLDSIFRTRQMDRLHALRRRLNKPWLLVT